MTDPASKHRAVTMPESRPSTASRTSGRRYGPSRAPTRSTAAPRWPAPASRVFSIDTPPPTACGSLHVGHVFSYTHTDCMARYKRMAGFEVFYPIGWDDNGLPTEKSGAELLRRAR